VRFFILAHTPATAFALTGHFWAALAALAAGHAYLLAGTLLPGTSYFGKVTSHFATDGRAVWLTFDDGPSPDTTLDLLDALDNAGVKATFFLIGAQAQRHPELVHAIRSRGHAVGNHTQNHPATSFWRLGPRRVRDEIETAQTTLSGAGATNVPRLFRAPAGMKNPFVFPVAKKLGLRVVAWSARGFDGRDRPADQIVSRIQRKVGPGGIILLHEGRPTTVATTREILGWLSANGFRPIIPPTNAFR
jgi:peptidoglycan/xylan/chitin deacetylase (PgdA/CDA1 family)